MSTMTELVCPYLVNETMAFRTTLDLSAAAKYEVVVTWYCEHPFHGIRLELGDGRADVEQHCGPVRCRGRSRTRTRT